MPLKLWQRTVKDNKSEITEKGLGDIDPSSASVIVLPGLAAVHGVFDENRNLEGKPDLAALSGYMKRPERFLGGTKIHESSDVKLFIISYENRLDNFDNLGKSNVDPKAFFSDEAMEFVDNVLMPRTVLVGADGNKTKRPVDEVVANVKKINLFSVSYGSAFAQQIYVSYKQRLSENKFDNKEQTQIISSIFLLALSNVSCGIKAGMNELFAIYFTHKQDGVAKNNIPDFESLQPEFESGKIAIENLSGGNRLCVWMHDLEESIAFYKESGSSIFISAATDSKKHNLPFYVERRDYPAILAFIGIMERSLIHAVNGESRQNIRSFLDPTPPLVIFTEAPAHKYDPRISDSRVDISSFIKDLSLEKREQAGAAGSAFPASKPSVTTKANNEAVSKDLMSRIG